MPADNKLTTRWARLQQEAARVQQGNDTVTPFAGNHQATSETGSLGPGASLAKAVQEMWQTFFQNFREDEREFELPHYESAALGVNDLLAQVDPGRLPDVHTLTVQVALLKEFLDARFRDHNERLNDLMSTCQQLRAQLDVSELSKCYNEDELASCQKMVRAELKKLGIDNPTSDDGVSRPSFELRMLLGALGRQLTNRVTSTTPIRAPSVSTTPTSAPTLTDEQLDIHSRDSLDWTKLHSAAYVGKAELVALLLEKGADPNAKAKDGTTPLHQAAIRGHVAIGKQLFAKGANLMAKDNEGNTALHLASERFSLEMIQALITWGAMVNARNEAGWTPLHLSVNKGKQEVVECLLAAGADLSAKAANGWTPLTVAVNCGHLQLSERLRDRGAR